MIKGLNLYQLLQVSPTCSDPQLKRSYKQMCLKWHPDKNQNKKQSKEMFQKICQAYAVLSNPQRRQLYDQTGQTGQINQTDLQQFFAHFEDFDQLQQLFNAEFFDDLIEQTFMGLFDMGSSKTNNKKRKGKKGRVGAKQQQELFRHMQKQLQKQMKKQKNRQHQKNEQQQQWQTDSQQEQQIQTKNKKNNNNKNKKKKKKFIIRVVWIRYDQYDEYDGTILRSF